MRVLVSGSTSLMGRRLVDLLIARGDEVVTFQRSNSTRADTTQFSGEIDDAGAVAQAVAGSDAVVHLAAKVGVTGTWDEFHRVNVVGTRTLAAAAKSANVARFVHVSSPSVAHTGEPLVGASAESAQPDSVRGHYTRSKAIAEQWILAQNCPEFVVLAIRPHLVWGPGDDQLIGRVVDRAKNGRLAIIGSGGALIDTTYVDNAADALVAAIDATPESGGEAFVVSNGEPRTVREILDRIVAAAGVRGPRASVPTPLAFWGGRVVERIWANQERLDDPPMTSFLAEQLSTAHWFDQRRTREALDWKPAITLDEGFELLRQSFATRDGS